MRPYRTLLFVGMIVLLSVCALVWRDHRESSTPPHIAGATEPGSPEKSSASTGDDLNVRPRVSLVAGGEVTDLLSAITPFRVWLDQVNRGQNADFQEGLTLAIARRSALHQLIQTNPQSALRHRIPAFERTRLPSTITAELEKLVDAFSQYEVIAVCGRETGSIERFAAVGGRRYEVHTYGPRLGTISQNKLPTHGIAIDDQLALAAEPYRMPDVEEALPAADVTQVQAYVGDALREFSSLNELNTWGTQQIAAEQELPSVFGQHTLLFLKVDFADAPGAPFTDQVIATSMVEADRFHRAESADRTSFKTIILPTVLRSAKLKSFYNADPNSYLALHDEATALARQYDAANGNSGAYNPDRYQHVVALFAKMSSYSAPDFGLDVWAGRAEAPGRRLWLNGDVEATTVAHELGHNLGLQHAYAWRPTGSSSIQPGTHIEYGDPFDVMGATPQSTVAGHFSVAEETRLELHHGPKCSDDKYYGSVSSLPPRRDNRG